MSRRSELQKLEAMKPKEKPKTIEDRVIELHKEDLYHYNGIAKLTGLSYRQVRNIIRDHLNRSQKSDTN